MAARAWVLLGTALGADAPVVTGGGMGAIVGASVVVVVGATAVVDGGGAVVIGAGDGGNVIRGRVTLPTFLT